MTETYSNQLAEKDKEIVDRNEWVSVEERLPDQCDEECICSDGKEVTCLIFKTDGFYSLVFEVIVAGITHWQPLPKPPIK
jgi:hypothetical protein